VKDSVLFFYRGVRYNGGGLSILFTFNSIKEKWKSVILHKQSFHKNSMDDTGVSMIVKESKYIEKVDFC
jgi:hypothetical protein